MSRSSDPAGLRGRTTTGGPGRRQNTGEQIEAQRAKHRMEQRTSRRRRLRPTGMSAGRASPARRRTRRSSRPAATRIQQRRSRRNGIAWTSARTTAAAHPTTPERRPRTGVGCRWRGASQGSSASRPRPLSGSMKRVARYLFPRIFGRADVSALHHDTIRQVRFGVYEDAVFPQSPGGQPMRAPTRQSFPITIGGGPSFLAEGKTTTL